MSYKPKTMLAHMGAAWAYASVSHAVRNKVGAVLVKHDNPIASGYNGTYPGDDNACELDNVTKPDVVHAEINCLDKLRNSHETAAGATLVVTHEPCLACAREIWKSRVEKVVFEKFYKSEKSPSNFDGLEYLLNKGVDVALFVRTEGVPDTSPRNGPCAFIRIDRGWIEDARKGVMKVKPSGW